MIFDVLIPAAAFIIAFIIGLKTGHISGKLVIDESDPETDRWTFEVNDPLDDVKKRKTVKLKIERGQNGGRT